MYVLEMRGITKRFPGVKALDNAQLFLEPGSVHALMGENGAGKSTLMKCLFGIYRKDEGEILLDGKPISFDSPRQALDNGVSMVHQELNQVLERSVLDNIWLGRLPVKGIVVNDKLMLSETSAVFERLRINVSPLRKIGSLSVSERQMVEIAKAVSCNAKIIVLDEPTSSLTENEVEHLFGIIRTLKKEGVAVIYISHKMEEILAIADEVTVMRDGRWIATEKSGDLTKDRIISLMVGRDLARLYPPKINKPTDEVVLKVRNLSGAYQPTIEDVSFDLFKGEILGVSGLVGSRRTELVETIFGLRKMKKGEIHIGGQALTKHYPRGSIARGIGLVTEERRATGIFPLLNIQFNAMIANIHAYARFGVMKYRNVAKDTQWVIDSLSVKTPSQKAAIVNLSGGNQQKVILGRWLLTSPKVLLLDEPTRGIDVGAKYEIYQLMIDLAEKGNGVVFISSEMTELLGVADRIMVMSNGRLAGVVDSATTSQEELLRLAAKYI
ncbi:MAG TPA: ATP-binding cassette domain-containing protein [Rectinemataceae bacterium]|nr:ATP-binding cassette domain-containing protein [Rectinemataceae bacterium]